MKIIAAGTHFPQLEINAHTQLHGKPYFCNRPKASDDDLMVEMALPICQKVIADARITAKDIDMILSISISPDHLFKTREMAAPRLCHPIQRELGAENAFVFDLIDADWTMAIELAEGFASQQGYKHILIVRTEVTSPSVYPDLTSGFDFVDGVGVLLVAPSELKSDATYHKIAGKNLQNAEIRMLSPIKMVQGKMKASFHFPYHENTIQTLNMALMQLLDRFESENDFNFETIVESWIPKHAHQINLWKHTYQHLGPFTLPAFVEEKLKQKHSIGYQENTSSETILSVCMNPFTMRYAAQLLLIEPVFSEEKIGKNTLESIFC